MFPLWRQRETLLVRANPTVKLALSVATMVALLFVHDPNVLSYALLGLFAAYFTMTGHSFKRLALLLIPFLFIFVSTASAMIFFGKGETTLWRFGLIHVTAESFYRGMHIGLRAFAFALTGLIFTLSRSFRSFARPTSCANPTSRDHGT